MRAIILAAGQGTRLGKYTKDLPKCMLALAGKTLIERQVAALRKAGISEIAIVRGYMAEKISLTNIAYFQNPEYETTNMVATLMQSRKFAEASKDGVLVCYADILYEVKLAKMMASFKGEVGVLVDDGWQAYWKARLGPKWEDDVESMAFDENSRITELGTPTRDISRATSRYVGMIRFSKIGFASFAK
ncbi:MAG: NTP transferase domain-containing protein, partial [Candidatus Micrarchaeia archaeon]